MVFLWEGRRDQDFKINLIYHMSHWIGVCALYDPNVIRGQASLLAEAKHIDTCAGCYGGEEYFKRGRRAGYRRLVGWNSEVSEMCVHA